MSNQEIPISLYDVRTLFGKMFPFFEWMVKEKVICANCFDTKGMLGMDIQEVYLSDLNHIIVKGICKECGGKVSRVLETGEDPNFYKQAMIFREQRIVSRN